MKIENQVCTLEQAKKLKELGIIQIGLAQWYHLKDMGQTTIFYTVQPVDENSCSAFTVAELGVMLPAYEESHKASDVKGYWYCGNIEDEVDWTIGDNQAHVMAKRLIHLLESEIVIAQEVNARLLQS